MTAPPIREIVPWAVAALLGYCLYSEHRAAASVERAIHDKVESHARAREAIFVTKLSPLQNRAADLETDLRDCLKATKPSNGRR